MKNRLVKTSKTATNLKMLLVACALTLCAPGITRADAPPQAQTQASQSQSPQTQPQAEDLGEGLSYFRVTQLTSQLPNIRDALEKHPALVLDLRGATGSNAAAQAFRAALADADAPASTSSLTPASTSTPASASTSAPTLASAPASETTDAPASAKPGARVVRFVLINVTTAPTIPFALGGGPAGNGVPGVLVIAPAPAGVFADVKVPCSDDDDKRACEAIAQGAQPRTLINRQPDKPRNDEAALMREQTGKPQQTAADAAALDATAANVSTPNAAAPDADAPNSISAAPSSAPSSVPSFASPSAASPDAPPPAPPTDSVLQLAVQIHRTLLALKKL